MQMYTPENPPKKGIAKQIWKVLVDAGLEPDDLHYNGGRRGVDGGGTWACSTIKGETWCGIHGKTMVYLQSHRAPYNHIIVGFTRRSCPFYQKIYDRISRERYYVCKYPSMTHGEFPENCPKPLDCTNCTDEYLTLRNNEYAKTKNNE